MKRCICIYCVCDAELEEYLFIFLSSCLRLRLFISCTRRTFLRTETRQMLFNIKGLLLVSRDVTNVQNVHDTQNNSETFWLTITHNISVRLQNTSTHYLHRTKKDQKVRSESWIIISSSIIQDSTSSTSSCSSSESSSLTTGLALVRPVLLLRPFPRSPPLSFLPNRIFTLTERAVND